MKRKGEYQEDSPNKYSKTNVSIAANHIAFAISSRSYNEVDSLLIQMRELHLFSPENVSTSLEIIYAAISSIPAEILNTDAEEILKVIEMLFIHGTPLNFEGDFSLNTIFIRAISASPRLALYLSEYIYDMKTIELGAQISSIKLKKGLAEWTSVEELLSIKLDDLLLSNILNNHRSPYFLQEILSDINEAIKYITVLLDRVTDEEIIDKSMYFEALKAIFYQMSDSDLDEVREYIYSNFSPEEQTLFEQVIEDIQSKTDEENSEIVMLFHNITTDEFRSADEENLKTDYPDPQQNVTETFAHHIEYLVGIVPLDPELPPKDFSL